MNAKNVIRGFAIGFAAIVMNGFVAAETVRLDRTQVGRSLAALDAVGAADGWGRVVLEKQAAEASGSNATKSGSRAEVEARVFGLDPNLEYELMINGASVGWFHTNAYGDGRLKVDGSSSSVAVVGRFEAKSASIRDLSGGFVLEGDFVRTSEAGGASAVHHEERIALVDPNGLGAAGLAEVERDDDDGQEFESRATGLMPMEQYFVVVDGTQVAVVTADQVGQAEVGLEYPDDSNPLPPEMQPIEGVRMVEWLDGNGGVVLTGTFTGVSSDETEAEDANESFEGYVSSFSADGFVLMSESGELEVVVTADTTFEHVSGLADLMIDDAVEVEGILVDGILTAVNIELRLDDDESYDSADDGEDDESDDSADDGEDDESDDSADDSEDDESDDSSGDGEEDGSDDSADDGEDDESDDPADDGEDDGADDSADDGEDDESDDSADDAEEEETEGDD